MRKPRRCRAGRSRPRTAAGGEHRRLRRATASGASAGSRAAADQELGRQQRRRDTRPMASDEDATKALPPARPGEVREAPDAAEPHGRADERRGRRRNATTRWGPGRLGHAVAARIAAARGCGFPFIRYPMTVPVRLQLAAAARQEPRVDGHADAGEGEGSTGLAVGVAPVFDLRIDELGRQAAQHGRCLEGGPARPDAHVVPRQVRAVGDRVPVTHGDVVERRRRRGEAPAARRGSAASARRDCRSR